MHGAHCIRHWATKQTTLSLSSGESELHGIAKGIQNGIGFQSTARDLDIHRKPRTHSDATASIGIARRRPSLLTLYLSPTNCTGGIILLIVLSI